jgi:tetratricopeptide (TPR) repeat protein
LNLSEIHKAISCCKTSLKLCTSLSDASFLIIRNYRTLGRAHSFIGENFMARKYFNQALDFTKKIADKYIQKEVIKNIYLELQAFYTAHYINKKEAKQGIMYGKKVIELAKESFLQDTISAAISVAWGYSLLQDYNNAKKWANTARDWINKLVSIGNNKDYVLENFLIVEEGHIWLRQGMIVTANKELKISHKLLKKIHHAPLHVRCKSYYLESLIRLNKLTKAYKVFNKRSSENIIRRNYNYLQYCITNYHAAIIKYKQFDWDLSLKHFYDFFVNVDKFCKEFLDKPIYDKLVLENTFEIVMEQKNIQKCLANSLKIFTVIYGENHSFVKDYVAKNCKQRSWIYDELKIWRYYLDYYIDCFKRFFGGRPV